VLGTHYDILCDPATITNERRGDLIISLPIYLSGISYISRRGSGYDSGDGDAGCDPATRGRILGLVGHTTAEGRGISALLDAGELPEYHGALIDILRNADDCPVGDRYAELEERVHRQGGDDESAAGAGAAGSVRGIATIYPHHAAAAEAFCSQGGTKHYLADLEIIREHAHAIPGCEFEKGNGTYTEDRYAIFTLPRGGGEGEDARRDERWALIARFMEILTRKAIVSQSLLDKAYKDSFQGQEMSEGLEAFFLCIRGAP
jgi:hypothetical protein